MKRALAATIVVAVTLALGIFTIATRPDISRGGQFLFADEGHNLRVNAVVSTGGRLYEDVFTPYGPAAAWSAIVAARLAGNTPLTYEVLTLALNTVALTLVFFTIHKYTTPLWAVGLTIACALPAMLAPGSMLGGLMASPYVPLERCVFALLLWLWDAPTRRSWKRSLAIGLVAGSCQWIRFGTVVLAVAGLVAADLAAERPRGGWRLIVGQLAVVAFGVVASELALVGWAYATLPGPVATDLIWPAYFVSSYDWVTAADRWPMIAPRVAIAQYGAALAGFVLGPFILWRSRRSPAAPLIAFLLCAYVIGTTTLFRHAHHFRQYAWWLTVVAALTAAVSGLKVRVAVVSIALVVFVTMMRGILSPAPAGVWVHSPAAGALYLSPQDAEDTAALNALAAAGELRGQSLIVGPLAAGWHALFEHPSPIRHAWFLTGVIRPRESDAVAAALNAASAIVVCGQNSTLSGLRLPEPIRVKLEATFGRSRPISARCVAHERE